MMALRLAWLLSLLASSGPIPSKVVGVVQDTTGASIPGVLAELKGTVINGSMRAKTDKNGVFELKDVPSGDYELVLFSPGFINLTVESIQILGGSEVSIPAIHLQVGMTCGISDYQPLKQLRLSQNESEQGVLAGSVSAQRDYSDQNPRALAGAQIKLFCTANFACASTITDSKGEFVFKRLRPGTYSIAVNSQGVYTTKESGFVVQAGFWSTYWPISVNRCRGRHCDPKRQPKKPLAHCE